MPTARGESPATACSKPGFDPVHRKLVADHAGRGDQDLLGAAAEQRAAARSAVRLALASPSLAGRRVGVARVDHDAADVLARAAARGTTSPARHRPGSS